MYTRLRRKAQAEILFLMEQAEAYTSEVRSTSALARAIRRFAQTDGDHNTAIPALTLHRRKAPTEPLHCIYNLGLGAVAQGDKQVMLGGESIDYGPGQSMLTTIDLPVVSPSQQIAKSVAWLKQHFVQ